jgi:hypothetical protein
MNSCKSYFVIGACIRSKRKHAMFLPSLINIYNQQTERSCSKIFRKQNRDFAISGLFEALVYCYN